MTLERGTVNPYVGPRPFERSEEDSSRFFGRGNESQEIVSLIFGHPLSLIYAQSGAGKTSLFNASIAPALENEGFDVLPLTRVKGVIPESIRLDQIDNTYIFNSLLNMEPEADPQGLLTDRLASFLKKRPRGKDETGEPVPRVLVFDQFEELFTLTPKGFLEQREAFFQQVTEALEADPLLRVVFMIREDFLAQLDPYARLLPERLRTRYRLERLQEGAALHAIKDPLSGTGRNFAEGVAESLVRELLVTRTMDAAGDMTEVVGQYVEPVQLQVVCRTLWSDLDSSTTEITQKQLEGFDVNRALSNFYNTAIQTVLQEIDIDEASLREWFGKTLITPMETRNTVYRGDTTTGGIPNAVVDSLESQHLIRAEYRAGVRWYELTHDRFIEAILEDNEEWYAARRETLGNPITDAARDWQRLGEDEGSLLRGALLEEANTWAQNHPRELDDLERSFLRASQSQYQRELESNARTARTFRNLTVGLVIVALVAVGSASRAIQQSNAANSALGTSQAAVTTKSAAEVAANIAKANAETEAERARVAEAEARSGELAIQSLTSLKTDPQLSLLLAVESVREQHTFESDDALRQALEASVTRAILSGHVGRLNALSFNPSAKLIATGGADGTARLWDAVTGLQLVSLTGDDDGVTALAFDPSGRILATAGADGNLELWNVVEVLLSEGDPQPAIDPKGHEHEGSIVALAFSPDGQWLVTAGADGIARLWDSTDLAELAVFEGHADTVNAVAISPDGRRLATASLDGTALLWDTETLESNVLEGHSSGINAVAFSPDGRFLVTAGADGTTRVWDASSGEEVFVLRGHSKSITSIAFSPDGSYLATASSDSTGRLWDVAEGTEMSVLEGHSDVVNAVVFSPNGELLATASADGTARIWGVPGGELQSELEGHGSSVNVVAFTPDNEVLATASSDGTARLWGVMDERIPKVLRGHDDQIWDIVFDPDGKWLASQGKDAAILWDFPTVLDAAEGEVTKTILKDSGSIGFGLGFSPDGSVLTLNRVTKADREEGEEGGTFTLLDAASLPEENVIASYPLVESLIFNGSFNETGNLLSMISSRNSFRDNPSTLLFWEYAQEEEVIEKSFPDISFDGLAFNPEGSLLATSGEYVPRGAGVIQLWDVSALRAGDDNSELAIIRTEELMVRVIFSPDGAWLISGGLDDTIRIWDVNSLLRGEGEEAEVAVLRGHEDGVIGLAISSNGRLLASGDLDGIVRIWDFRQAIESGGVDAERSILRGHSGSVYAVEFSPDSHWLVSGGNDEDLRLWTVDPVELASLACSRAVRNLSQSEWNSYMGSTVEYKPTCQDLPYHPSVLDAMIEQGREYVRNGQDDEAIEIWQKVLELDPERDFDPDIAMVDTLLEVGEQSARVRDYGKAVAALRRAIGLDPTLETEVAGLLREIIFDQQTLPSSDQFAEVLSTLKFVVELDPSLRVDVAGMLLEIVSKEQTFNSAEQVDSAVSAVPFALELDPDLNKETLAEAYHAICRFGSLDGFAESALPACQRAVALADDMEDFIGQVRGDRGIARVLIGDLPGALTDFTFFIEWAEDHSVPEEIISKREAWIDLLEEGRNPFEEDPELLQEVRDEE